MGFLLKKILMQKGFQIISKAGKTQIRIIGNISSWQNSSEDFRNQIDKLIQEGKTDVEIYINSFGGSVFEANEIANLLLQFEGQITFTLGSVCASAATIIIAEVLSQRENVPVRQYRNGQFMIHNVKATVSGEIKDFEAAINLMRNVQDNVKQAYSRQTGLSIEELTQMMDKETWMTAVEAKEKGFITEVIDKNDNTPVNYSDLMNCGYTNTPTIFNKSKTQNKNQMNKIVNEALGLSQDASDIDVVNKINELKQAKEQAEQKLAQVEAERKQEKVNAILDKAIEDRKILASERDAYAKLLENDFETTKSIIDNKQALPKLSDGIKDDPKDDKDYDWYVENAPDELSKMVDAEPDKFAKLYKAKFGKNPFEK